jgi:hypothetical protein
VRSEGRRGKEWLRGHAEDTGGAAGARKQARCVHNWRASLRCFKTTFRPAHMGASQRGVPERHETLPSCPRPTERPLPGRCAGGGALAEIRHGKEAAIRCGACGGRPSSADKGRTRKTISLACASLDSTLTSHHSLTTHSPRLTAPRSPEIECRIDDIAPPRPQYERRVPEPSRLK